MSNRRRTYYSGGKNSMAKYVATEYYASGVYRIEDNTFISFNLSNESTDYWVTSYDDINEVFSMYKSNSGINGAISNSRNSVPNIGDILTGTIDPEYYYYRHVYAKTGEIISGGTYSNTYHHNKLLSIWNINEKYYLIVTNMDNIVLYITEIDIRRYVLGQIGTTVILVNNLNDTSSILFDINSYDLVTVNYSLRGDIY